MERMESAWTAKRKIPTLSHAPLKCIKTMYQAVNKGLGLCPSGVRGSAPAGCGAAPRKENFAI